MGRAEALVVCSLRKKDERPCARRAMSKTLAILGLVLISVVGGSAQSRRADWLRGIWEGTGYQSDDASTWTMRLTAGRRRFSIEYPSLDCGGEWKGISINHNKARFREILSHGKERCVDNGNVVIERFSNTQIVYLFSNRGSRTVTAVALLNRKK